MEQEKTVYSICMGHKCNRRTEEKGAIRATEEQVVKESNLKNWSLHVLNFNALSVVILHWTKKLCPEHR